MYKRKKRTSRKIYSIFLLLFGMSNAFIVWITLLSRKPAFREVYLIPFYSYYRGICVNVNALIENVENIVLFIPYGFFLSILIGKRNKIIIFSGFICSLLLEIVQLITGLGSFEIDDLINNTLGVIVGIVVFLKIHIIYDFSLLKKRTIVIVNAIIIINTIVIDSIYDAYHYKKMSAFASYNDLDNNKNILLLDGGDGNVRNTKVFVQYQREGNIIISGNSDRKSWYRIGDLILEEGTYLFTGLSGVEEKTIAIELEYYDEKEKKYFRLTPDIGPINEAEFALEKATHIIAYICVYPGEDYYVIAKPAIYKQGD